MDPLASSSPPVAGALGVLEFGTNSLKLHRYSLDLDRFEPFRVEWEVGFEIYSSGHLQASTIDHMLQEVSGLLESCGVQGREDLFGIATGAFRDAENREELLRRLHSELSIPVRILTGPEEAWLLIRAIQNRTNRRPTMFFDLGGGRLQMVFLGAGESYIHQTLPLGVIWIQQLASFDSGTCDEDTATRWIRENIRSAQSLSSPEIFGTGGTVRTIAQVADTNELTLEILERMHQETRTHGVPRFLTPRRQATFVPGLLVVKHILTHVEAKILHYHPIGLGEVLMEHLRPFYKALGGELRRAFIDHKLDIFT